ncbi:hypothetical protein [Methylobacterium indicum]|uniref:hypothetical protein n=1 Tax=Methylobacterium indicum TaxID=1775910 RepID=UPI000AE15199|nr:hypothetical protein [Methylobacterium indicum]
MHGPPRIPRLFLATALAVTATGANAEPALQAAKPLDSLAFVEPAQSASGDCARLPGI